MSSKIRTLDPNTSLSIPSMKAHMETATLPRGPVAMYGLQAKAMLLREAIRERSTVVLTYRGDQKFRLVDPYALFYTDPAAREAPRKFKNLVTGKSRLVSTPPNLHDMQVLIDHRADITLGDDGEAEMVSPRLEGWKTLMVPHIGQVQMVSEAANRYEFVESILNQHPEFLEQFPVRDDFIGNWEFWFRIFIAQIDGAPHSLK